MRVLLTTLNARYVHSSLALYYLKSFCNHPDYKISVQEFTVNSRVEEIVGDIFRLRPDVVGFSCYIWNMESTLKLCQQLKKVLPHLIIVVGGPEVSFSPAQVLVDNPGIDYVICGEGEVTFQQFLSRLYQKESMENLLGLGYRKNGSMQINEPRPEIKNLDSIPFPYQRDELEALANRIVYYEASRGCPFNCQYCLSSTMQGVRFFSLERVKDDLTTLINAGVKQVKFVDRTFNCHPIRTREIISFLLKTETSTNFHFEIAGDLLDEETMGLLRNAPDGLFQLEIGIQSTNQQTLEAINRQMNLQQLKSNVEKLRSKNNIHLHLDLIAGLPYEDMTSFESSFNYVYGMEPHQLQVGFLKLLKGARLREQAEKFGLIYQDYAPYEILSTPWLGYDEILELKDIEDLVEKYHNSGRYSLTINYACQKNKDGPFAFFRQLSYYIRENLGFGAQGWDEIGRLLWNYLKTAFSDEKDLFHQLIVFEMLLNQRLTNLPVWLVGGNVSKLDCTLEFVKNSGNISAFLPHFQGMEPKKIYKMMRVETFRHRFSVQAGRVEVEKNTETTLIFDYSRKHIVSNYPEIILLPR